MKNRLFTFFAIVILFISFNNSTVKATSSYDNKSPYKCPVSKLYGCSEEEVVTEVADHVVSEFKDRIYSHCFGPTSTDQKLVSCTQEWIKDNLNSVEKELKTQLILKLKNQSIYPQRLATKITKKASHDLLAYANDPLEIQINKYGRLAYETTTTTAPSVVYDPKVSSITSTSVVTPSWISNQYSKIRKNQMQTTTIIISFVLIILSIIYTFYKRNQNKYKFKLMEFKHNSEIDKYKVYDLSKTQMDQDYEVKLKQLEYDKSIKERDFMMVVTKEERDYMLKQRELDIKERKNPNQLMDVIEQNKDVQFRIKK